MRLASERRVDPRHGAHFDVRFSRATDAARAFNAFSVNFSSGGLCLRSSTAYPAGEALSMSLSIEGVRFVNLKPPVRAQLERVARALAERGPPLT